MYKSPIELITGPIVMKQVEEREKQIYECIQQYGINVDKDELIRALQYDRSQYDKGYRDGYRDAIIKFAEMVKEEFDRYGATEHFHNIVDNLVKEKVSDVA